MINVVDFFAGCGGGAIGLHRNKGFNTVLAIDFFKPAVDSYNTFFNKDICKLIDVTTLTDKELKELTKNEKIHLVIGSPSCQGFSTIQRHNYKKDNLDISDPNSMEHKNHLFQYFLNHVKTLNPTIVIMENRK